jgi:hypothetical protein
MKKKNQVLAGLFLAVVLVSATNPLSAQRASGNKNVISQERTVEPFTRIDVGGAFNVYLTIKDQFSLIVETDENLQEKITTKIHNEKLSITSSGIRNATKLNIYVSAPEITYVNLSGAATFKSSNTLSADYLELIASGASNLSLDIDVDELVTEASGASTVKLTGTAHNHNVKASGASDVKAANLLTTNTTATASGAADVKINATEKVTRKISGAGSVKISGAPEIMQATGVSSNTSSFNVNERGDTTRVVMGNLRLEVIDGDTTTVNLGSRSLVVDDKGNVTWQKKKKQPKFDGHWAGIEIGINGYLNKDFMFDMPKDYEFLDLTYEKSIDFSINFFEQNINLVNNKFGMVTGVGVRWNNYRLGNNILLVPDTTVIFGYPSDEKDWRKSKMVVNYLNIPLLFEYQTNPYTNKNSFHVSAGMIFGWRFRTYTKMMDRDNGRNVSKTKGEGFHMNPFRYDATARIGWGVINLYATYSLNTLFKNDRGPELYPFAVGLQLVGW